MLLLFSMHFGDALGLSSDDKIVISMTKRGVDLAKLGAEFIKFQIINLIGIPWSTRRGVDGEVLIGIYKSLIESCIIYGSETLVNKEEWNR